MDREWSIWGFTKIRDIGPQIVGFPCNKNPNKVPLVSETPIWFRDCGSEVGSTLNPKP